MKWIIEPNKKYDRLEEPLRFIVFIVPLSLMMIVFGLIDRFLIGLLIMGLLGLYRVSYFIIGSSRNPTKTEKGK